MPNKETVGTLKLGEFHPAASDAYKWLNCQGWAELVMWQESFSSCSIEGNRIAEVCSETLSRFMKGEPVSDRYLLGLCWMMRYGNNEKKNKRKAQKKLKKGKP